MFPKRCLGIELSRHLRIAALYRARGTYRVESMVEIENFAAMSPLDQRRAAADVMKRYPVVPAQVLLSLPASFGTVRQIDLPIEVRASLKSVVELQIEALSPWPAAEVYWDYSFDPPLKHAKNLTVCVTLVPRDTVDRWADFFQGIGLPLSGCLLAPVAAAGSAATLSGARPTAVLTCDDDAVDGVLFCGGRLAHHLQREGPQEAMAGATVQVLAGMLRISADSVSLICHGSQAGLVAPLPPTPLPLPGSFETIVVPGFGAIAAGVSGFAAASRRSNLLPLNRRHRSSPLRLVPTYVLCGLLLLVGCGFLLRNLYQTYVYSQAIAAAIQDITPAVRERTRLDGELNALLETEQTLAGAVNARDPNLDVLKELTAVLPPDTWLSAYAYQGDTVTLTGFSNSASEVQKLLEASPLLKNVQFSSAITRDAAMDRFSLRAAIESGR